MAKLTVEVVTPEKRLVSVQADEAVVPGHNGLFGVRPGHTPFLSVLDPGTLTLKDERSSQAYFVAGGFVEVSEDRVLVLAEGAEPVAQIDVEAAKKRLEQAHAALRGMSAEDVRFEVESASVRRETARIASAGKR